tara:strand:+ start:4324 stop:5202 length:879 start_codon:yes stop_codon:yes gene_type:complete
MKNLIFTIGAGHCNNEYTSWLLNHSPDTGPRQPYLWTPYESEWGTHHRASDEWVIEQYDNDDNQPLRRSLVQAYTHTGLRNPKFPHFLRRDLLENYIPRILKVHKHDAMSIYLNVLDVSESIDYIKSKAPEWGVNVHFVSSFWDFEFCPVRHYYVMMEFDPTSTDEDHPDNPIDLNFMCCSIIDRHNNQILKFEDHYDKLDLVAFQSERNPIHWFEKVGLTPPTDLQYAIDYYRKINLPKTSDLNTLNELTWKEVCDRYMLHSKDWEQFQRKVSQNNTQNFKKHICPRLIDK